MLAGALVFIFLSACGGTAHDASQVPTPIGAGPAFRPPPGVAAPCLPGSLHGRYRVHVELFLRQRVVIVPAGIGVGKPWRERFGRIESARCRAELRTLDPSGIVEFDRTDLTVEDLFRVWGRDPLRPPVVRIYVNGKPAPEGEVPLRDGDEIVLESNGYVPPHASFLFPPR